MRPTCLAYCQNLDFNISDRKCHETSYDDCPYAYPFQQRLRCQNHVSHCRWKRLKLRPHYSAVTKHCRTTPCVLSPRRSNKPRKPWRATPFPRGLQSRDLRRITFLLEIHGTGQPGCVRYTNSHISGAGFRKGLTMRRLCLVTGASAGIGEAYSRVFAERGLSHHRCHPL